MYKCLTFWIVALSALSGQLTEAQRDEDVLDLGQGQDLAQGHTDLIQAPSGRGLTYDSRVNLS